MIAWRKHREKKRQEELHNALIQKMYDKKLVEKRISEQRQDASKPATPE